MGWLAALLSLVFTLVTGLLLALVGAIFASWVLQAGVTKFQRDQTAVQKPSFIKAWRISCLALASGFVIGKVVELAVGGPSLLTPLIAVPIYTLWYAWLLRWRLPEPFANPAWKWRTPALALLATLAGGIAITLLMALIGGMLQA